MPDSGATAQCCAALLHEYSPVMRLAANPPIEILRERVTGAQGRDLFRAPDWHADVLRERLKREERGEAVWRSVDETFDRIRAQIATDRMGRGSSQAP